MRTTWRRLSPQLTLELAAIERLVAPVLPNRMIIGVERTIGGIANTNFKIVPDRGPPVLLRLYQLGGDQAAKEVALIRHFAGQIPVPAVLQFTPSNLVTGHPCAVMAWVEGQRLDQLVLSGANLAACARSLGEALARIHAVLFSSCGFLRPDLTISSRFDFDRAGLIAFVQQVTQGSQIRDWFGRDLTTALAQFAAREGDCLSEWAGPSLVHGDLNGSNILVCENARGEWDLAAILDWEFAFSGPPGFDFAHLLRQPLDGTPAFGEIVARSYRATGQILPERWRKIARMTDLFAWLDMINRPRPDPMVIKDACRAVRTTIANW